MSGQNFSAGLRPAVCFGAQKSCFGGSKWCSSDFEGCETIFKRFLGIFGCFSSIFARYRMSSRRVTGQGSPGAAPRRLNVGNMLDVDRSPKCCFNCSNTFGDPYSVPATVPHRCDSRRPREGRRGQGTSERFRYIFYAIRYVQCMQRTV